MLQKEHVKLNDTFLFDEAENDLFEVKSWTSFGDFNELVMNEVMTSTNREERVHTFLLK